MSCARTSLVRNLFSETRLPKVSEMLEPLKIPRFSHSRLLFAFEKSFSSKIKRDIKRNATF